VKLIPPPAGFALLILLFASAARAEPPVITADDPPPTGTVGEAYLYDLDITPVPQEFSANPLPNGLQLDPSNFTVSGTPTESGTFNVVIHAKSFGGEEAQVTRQIVIAPAPPPDDSIPPTVEITSMVVDKLSGANNYAFHFKFLANDNLGIATLEYRGAVAHGALDAWKPWPYLGPIDDSFVIILSCTAFEFEVRAVDLAGNVSNAANRKFEAPDSLPVITSAAAAKGKVGKRFAYQIKAAGADKFTASGLPPGCKLDPKTGAIKGVPT
jgi:hypothetical protein